MDWFLYDRDLRHGRIMNYEYRELSQLIFL